MRSQIPGQYVVMTFGFVFVAPPPDTVMVKCEFCGTQQMWKETCMKCGAPPPKPELP